MLLLTYLTPQFIYPVILVTEQHHWFLVFAFLFFSFRFGSSLIPFLHKVWFAHAANCTLNTDIDK